MLSYLKYSVYNFVYDIYYQEVTPLLASLSAPILLQYIHWHQTCCKSAIRSHYGRMGRYLDKQKFIKRW